MKIIKGGGLKLDPFYIILNNFGISLTVNAVLDHILSSNTSKFFLAKKTSQLNSSLVAAFRFMMLTPKGTSFLCLEIVRVFHWGTRH